MAGQFAQQHERRIPIRSAPFEGLNPLERPLHIVPPIFPLPFPMRHDDGFRVQVRHAGFGAFEGGAVEEGKTPFQRRVALALDDAPEARDPGLPSTPFGFQEGLAEILRQVGEDQGAGRAVEEHHLVHRGGAGDVDLLDLIRPIRRGRVGQRRLESEVPAFRGGRGRAPELRARIGFRPILKIKVVDLVRADQVADGAERIDPALEVGR